MLGAEAVSVQSFRDLVAWRRGMDVVVATDEITGAWPKEETFGLASQVHRAVVSVVANIGEGQGGAVRESSRTTCRSRMAPSPKSRPSSWSPGS